jgi:hypothetical protein
MAMNKVYKIIKVHGSETTVETKVIGLKNARNQMVSVAVKLAMVLEGVNLTFGKNKNSVEISYGMETITLQVIK